MNGSERRENILKLIKSSDKPLSGSALAKLTSVSRQIIVSDISKLKEEGADIIATNRGYVLNKPPMVSRVFKVVHTDGEIGDELNSIIDMGGMVKDVFVWHRIYGRIEAELDIATRQNVAEYLESLKTGRSSPLKNVTSEYHYHTVMADSDITLDKIENKLSEMGFLVKED